MCKVALHAETLGGMVEQFSRKVLGLSECFLIIHNDPGNMNGFLCQGGGRVRRLVISALRDQMKVPFSMPLAV